MKRAALVAAAALALAAPAAATLPVFNTGSSVGEGLPLKAYASITPTVHLFGDELTARVAVVADTKWVDARRLRVSTDFSPYRTTRGPLVLRVAVGRFAQVTYTWTIRCITSSCVPRQPPSDTYHVFHFAPARIQYLARNGTPAYGISASFPPVEVLSQVSPGVAAFLARTKHLNWQVDFTPVAAPTYRTSPTLLFWIALGVAGVLALAAAGFLARWALSFRPVRTPAAVAPVTTLERALAVLRYAHESGDETLQRKAFERVAGELGVERADELTLLARELAWSPRTPQDDEVEHFTAKARETAEDPP